MRVGDRVHTRPGEHRDHGVIVAVEHAYIVVSWQRARMTYAEDRADVVPVHTSE